MAVTWRGARRRWTACGAACLAVAVGTASGFAAATPAQAVRVDVPPVIDGRLDDAAWAGATVLDGFAQSSPQPGAPPRLRTEVWIVHDGRRLHVAVRAHDDTPQRIAARSLRRDEEALEGDDHLSLVLDPRGRGGNGFVFRVNPLGNQRDALIFDGDVPQAAWDAVWESTAVIDDGGWTAELSIPLAALAAPADGRAWRFNLQRYVAATGERFTLHGAVAGRPVETLADAQPLEGVQPLDAGWGLRLRPGLRSVHERRADGRRRDALEASLDAFQQLAPGVTGTLTLNTDFADAELDDARVSLSRFELFRPERRAFFNQDAGRFAFGGLDDDDEPPLLAFFSRRIGLGRTLDAGLKVSGSAGPLEFGALAAQVERGDRPRAPRVGVLRMAGDVAASSAGRHRVGMIATQGHPEGQAGSSLAGMDYQFLSTTVAGDRTLQAYAWAQQSRNAGLGTGHAQGARIAWPNDGLWAKAGWWRADDRFEPALGFLQERGVEHLDGELGWRERRADGSILLPLLYAGVRRRLDGRERGDYVGPNVELETAQGDLFGAEVFVDRERIAQAFELLPGVTVPARDHRWTAAAVYASLSDSRAISADLTLRTGGYFDGRLELQALALTWRPNARWSFTGSHRRQDVSLRSGRFVAHDSTLRLDHAGSPRSQQGLLLQHDNVSRQTRLAVRLRWTFAPGREWLASLDRVRPTRDAADAPDALATRATLQWTWNWER